jgi:hypothetical protein
MEDGKMRNDRHESVGGSVFGGYGFCNYTPAASSRPSHLHAGMNPSAPADEDWLSHLLQQASQMLARLRS